MLPEQDGFDVLRKIRNNISNNVPVVMLSAKGDQTDKVVGLEIGADDYVCKPFYERELLARLKAVLRRSDDSKTRPDSNVVTLADLELCRESLSVKIAGTDVSLTNVEFSLLDRLISCAGKKISPQQLSMDVLGRGYTSIDRSLSVHISRLRHKLGPYPNGKERIRTLRNAGYMYIYPQNDLTGETL
jgi:two-component system response regulator CpxR